MSALQPELQPHFQSHFNEYGTAMNKHPPLPLAKTLSLSARAALLALAGITTGAFATPYIPSSGQQVIETLPRRGDATQQELRRLRSQLNAAPTDLALAATLAQRYIALGRSETDPRYLGYAQAALAPWWQQPAPPVQVRLLRATLLQSTHHFDAALADLDGVIAADPANAQAWLTRATVQTVRGNYSDATASCARLSALANELVSITCIANIGALTGRAQRSEQLLELTLQRSANAPRELQVWALTLLAEMSARRGDAAGAANAESRFKAALALSPNDSYLQGAYADFLLEQHRAAEVLALLRDQSRIDALLLRRALAHKQLGGGTGDKALAADVAELDARFNAAMQRGDTVHQREQARFELHLRGNPRAALELARRNWAVQKEPADVLIYLESAAQAHDAAAARTVLDWLAANHTENAAASRLAQQLKAGT
jgi:Tfp pilus assembly protein PilF